MMRYRRANSLLKQKLLANITYLQPNKQKLDNDMTFKNDDDEALAKL